MSLTIENIVLVGSILLFISIIIGKTSYRFGVPTLLFFLGVGMLAGSEGFGGIHFNNPSMAQFIGVIALNFILFSGGLSTGWKSVKPVLGQGVILSTLGVLLTAGFLGTFIYFVTGLTIYESLLLGSIVSSTDAAAVFSILRSKSLALKSHLRPTLELESGSNDPMAYVLTIMFLTLVTHPDQDPLSIIPIFFQQMLLGGVAGLLFGRVSKWIVNHINLDFEGLYPVLVIALMFVTFSATDFVGGNGFLAIYICAVYLGNQNLIHKSAILKMYDGLAWLMQIVLFLTLGLLVFPSHVFPFVGIGLVISLFLIIVARPLSVFISLVFFKMKMRRRLYVSWVGLRGAVPIVFATYPLLAGVEQAELIFNIVFFISVTSVLIQGTSLPIVARWLKVAKPVDEKSITEVDRITLNLPKSSSEKFRIRSGSFAEGKRIVDLNFPKSARIILIEREGKYILPNGGDKVTVGDVLTVLADDYREFPKIRELLNQEIKVL